MTTRGRPFIGLVAQTRLPAGIRPERWRDHTTTGCLRTSFAKWFSCQIARGGLFSSSLGSGKVSVDVYAFACCECPRARLRHYPGFGAAFFRKRSLNFFQPRQRASVRHSLFRGSWTSGRIFPVSSVLGIDIARASRRFTVANTTPGNIAAPSFLTPLPGFGRHDGPDRLARTIGTRCPAMRYVCTRVAG